jgi:hypothetical protein
MANNLPIVSIGGGEDLIPAKRRVKEKVCGTIFAFIAFSRLLKSF